jgi:hypothetical protein
LKDLLLGAIADSKVAPFWSNVRITDYIPTKMSKNERQQLFGFPAQIRQPYGDEEIRCQPRAEQGRRRLFPGRDLKDNAGSQAQIVFAVGGIVRQMGLEVIHLDGANG